MQLQSVSAYLLESWLPPEADPFHTQSLENEQLLHHLERVSTWQCHSTDREMLHSVTTNHSNKPGA